MKWPRFVVVVVVLEFKPIVRMWVLGGHGVALREGGLSQGS